MFETSPPRRSLGLRFSELSHGRKFLLVALFLALLFCCLYFGAKLFEKEVLVAPEMRLSEAVACDDVGSCTKVLLLHGQIVSKSSELAEQVVKLSASTKIEVVCISSPGGNNVAAMRIADAINRANLTTCVANEFKLPAGAHLEEMPLCNSSCAWVVLAGRKRVAFSSTAKLGFHASARRTSIAGFEIDSTHGLEEEQNFAKHIKAWNAQSEGSGFELSRHLKLLQESFTVGTGEPKYFDATQLLRDYSFFTSVDTGSSGDTAK